MFHAMLVRFSPLSFGWVACVYLVPMRGKRSEGEKKREGEGEKDRRTPAASWFSSFLLAPATVLLFCFPLFL